MNNVDRYKIDAEGYMIDSPNGQWVDYEDYAALQQKLDVMAAENAVQRQFIATCFRNAGDGGDMHGADIQELGECLKLFRRETYQPVLHGYICGHEPGEDSVYVMNKTPATDAYLNSVRAEGVEMFSKHCFDKKAIRFWDSAGEEARMFAVSLSSSTHDTADKAG